MKYAFDIGDRWTKPVSESKVYRFFIKNCSDYGSKYPDWKADMFRCRILKGGKDE